MRVLTRLLCVVLLVPSQVLALSYDTANLPYPDAPQDRETAVALSTLSRMGIIEGHEDGYFRGRSLLNRAEFVKIVLGLLEPSAFPNIFLDCFPDVDPEVWYADPVCSAKYLGLVEGDDLPGGKKQFAPSRNINYAEAVKVLVLIAEMPIVRKNGEQWYAGYIRAADLRGLTLSGLKPNQFITRNEMVLLAAGFYAYNRDELDLLRASQKRAVVVSSSSSEDESSGSSVSSESSVSSDESSESSEEEPKMEVTYDSDSNVTMRDDLLQLNTISPVLAAANIFSNSEPLEVKEIVVNLVSDVNSIDSFLVYDQDAAYLGRATRTGDAEYKLFTSVGVISVPHREEFSFYVRSQLKPYNGGGVSGEDVRISSLGITADGGWSNREYNQSTTDIFNQSQTARSIVTSIENAGDAEGVLVSGIDQQIASFRFTGEKGDGSADLRVTELTFQIEQVGGVTLSNPKLGSAESSDRINCSIVSSTIVCSAISGSLGSFEDAPRVLRVFSDVDVPAEAQNPGLRLTLNQAGTVSSAGSVSWTDGVTVFTWVPGGNPVARGTYWKG